MKIELTEERKFAVFVAMLALTNIHLTSNDPEIAKNILVLRDMLEEDEVY